MRVSGSNAFLKNSLFLKNRCGASYGGGAVCAYGDSELRVENCSFVENEGAAGGAIGVNATAKNPSPVFILLILHLPTIQQTIVVALFICRQRPLLMFFLRLL